MPAKAAADAALQQALVRVNAVAEHYPDLKANQNFLELQSQLAETENQIAFARQYYNDAVASLNKLVMTIPWMLFTGIANVHKREFYDAPEGQQVAPQVSFDNPTPPGCPGRACRSGGSATAAADPALRRAAGGSAAAAQSHRTSGAPRCPTHRPGSAGSSGHGQPSAANSSSVSSMAAAAVFSSRCATLDVPGIGSITGEQLQQPGQRDLRRRGVVGGRRPRSSASSRRRGRRTGRHGMKAMPSAVQWSSSSWEARSPRLKRFCTETIGGDLLGGGQLLDGDLGQADVADLALVLQGLELADLVLERDVGVDAVQLEQVDPLDAAAGAASSSTCWRRYAGRPTGIHDVRALAGQPGLGRDDHVVGVRVQRLGDQLLGDVRAVGVGGVDEGDAELERAAQHAQRLVAVLGLAPDALAGELHGAVAEADDVAGRRRWRRCRTAAATWSVSVMTAPARAVARPVRVEGALAVDALVGVGAEVVAQRLDQGGGQALAAQAVEVGQRRAERRHRARRAGGGRRRPRARRRRRR